MTHGTAFQAAFDHHAAFIGEFNGVAGEVDHHVAQHVGRAVEQPVAPWRCMTVHAHALVRRL